MLDLGMTLGRSIRQILGGGVPWGGQDGTEVIRTLSPRHFTTLVATNAKRYSTPALETAPVAPVFGIDLATTYILDRNMPIMGDQLFVNYYFALNPANNVIQTRIGNVQVNHAVVGVQMNDGKLHSVIWDCRSWPNMDLLIDYQVVATLNFGAAVLKNTGGNPFMIGAHSGSASENRWFDGILANFRMWDQGALVRQFPLHEPMSSTTITDTVSGLTGTTINISASDADNREADYKGDWPMVGTPADVLEVAANVWALPDFGSMPAWFNPAAWTMKVGMNNHTILQYDAASPLFTNLMKCAGAWRKEALGQTGIGNDSLTVDYDSKDWPTDLHGNQVSKQITALPSGTPAIPDGLYTLTWTGEGTVDISTGGTLFDQPDAFTKRYTVAATKNGLTVTISDTDPNANGNYIKDVAIIHEDDIATPSQTFRQSVIDKFAPFAAVRFMQATDTNQPHSLGWENRILPDNAGQTRTAGVTNMCIEYQVEMANTNMQDLWLNLHHRLSDAEITEILRYVRNNLNVALTAWVEFGNEIWNSGTFGAQYAFFNLLAYDAQTIGYGTLTQTLDYTAQGRPWADYLTVADASLFSLYSPLTELETGFTATIEYIDIATNKLYIVWTVDWKAFTAGNQITDGTTTTTILTKVEPLSRHSRVMRLAGRRTGEVGIVAKATWSETAGVEGSTIPTMKFACPGQGNDAWSAEQIWNYSSDTSVFDFAAMGLYIGGSSSLTVSEIDAYTVDEILDELDANATVRLGDVTAYRAFCDARGLELAIYEGGTHVTSNSGATPEAKMRSVMLHPRMHEISAKLLQGANDNGADLFMWFVLVGNWNNTTFGAIDSFEASLETAPKARALYDGVMATTYPFP